ncbi:DUF4035 domain-containing protein [Micromonospora sp. Llam0]|uniref:phage tail assembly protein T n=1 Tax=Micromonospora sp. Llam0 TaxID=2485143 RepID=UPI0013151901|nr:DUF4035 domain-containing protein [Micromonospora sp. Llam0]
MDSREISGWMAYERVTGPLGPARGDIQAAIVASTIANSNRGKRGKRYRPEDFIPEWDRPEMETGPQDEHDHLRLIKQLNAQMGGRTRRRGGDPGGDSGGPHGQDRRRRRRR